MTKSIQKTPHLSQQLISSFLILCFLVSNLPVSLRADLPEPLPASSANRHGVTEASPSEIIGSLTLPEELGSVQKIFAPKVSGKHSDKLVVYLQDAHANYDSEVSIRKILHYFEKKYGLSLVMLEGGEGPLDTLLFKSFPAENLKEKVLDEYLKNGDLSGAEAASLASNDTAEYYGIENLGEYQANKQALLEARGNQEALLKQLAEAYADLKARSQTVFSEPSRSFLEAHESFVADHFELLAYLKTMSSLYASVSGEKLAKSFPLLAAILKASRRERLGTVLLGTHRPYLMLKGMRVLEELERLEDELRRVLPASAEEKELLEEFHQWELFERLARLELTRKDWQQLKAYSVQRRAYRKLDAHLAFYSLAEKRDAALFQNMLNLIQKKKTKVSAVVTGGFHHESITQSLEKEGIAYIVIAPRISEAGDSSVYFKAMEGRRSFMKDFETTLWDALAKDYARKLSATLNPFERAYILKNWRDRIIQGALAEGRITQASIYTRYVDDLLEENGAEKGERDDAIRQRFEIFRNGVLEIWNTREFSFDAVSRLVERVNRLAISHLAPEIALIRATRNVIPRPQAEESLSTGILLRQKAADQDDSEPLSYRALDRAQPARAELRSGGDENFNQKIIQEFETIFYPKLKAKAQDPGEKFATLGLGYVYPFLDESEQVSVTDMSDSLKTPGFIEAAGYAFDGMSAGEVADHLTNINLVLEMAEGEGGEASAALITLGFVYRFVENQEIKDKIRDLLLSKITAMSKASTPAGALMGLAYLYPHLEKHSDKSYVLGALVAVANSPPEFFGDMKMNFALRGLGYIHKYLSTGEADTVYSLLKENAVTYWGARWGLGYAYEHLSPEQQVRVIDLMTRFAMDNQDKLHQAGNQKVEIPEGFMAALGHMYHAMNPTEKAAIYMALQAFAIQGISEALYALAVMYADAKKSAAGSPVEPSGDDSIKGHGQQIAQETNYFLEKILPLLKENAKGYDNVWAQIGLGLAGPHVSSAEQMEIKKISGIDQGITSKGKAAFELLAYSFPVLSEQDQDWVLVVLKPLAAASGEAADHAKIGLGYIFQFLKDENLKKEILDFLLMELAKHKPNMSPGVPVALAYIYPHLKDPNAGPLVRGGIFRNLRVIVESESEYVSKELKSSAYRALGMIYGHLEAYELAEKSWIYDTLNSHLDDEGAMWGMGYAYPFLGIPKQSALLQTILLKIRSAINKMFILPAQGKWEDLAIEWSHQAAIPPGLLQAIGHIYGHLSQQSPEAFKEVMPIEIHELVFRNVLYKFLQQAAEHGNQEAMYALAVIFADAKKEQPETLQTKESSLQNEIEDFFKAEVLEKIIRGADVEALGMILGQSKNPDEVFQHLYQDYKSNSEKGVFDWETLRALGYAFQHLKPVSPLGSDFVHLLLAQVAKPDQPIIMVLAGIFEFLEPPLQNKVKDVFLTGITDDNETIAYWFKNGLRRIYRHVPSNLQTELTNVQPADLTERDLAISLGQIFKDLPEEKKPVIFEDLRHSPYAAEALGHAYPWLSPSQKAIAYPIIREVAASNNPFYYATATRGLALAFPYLTEGQQKDAFELLKKKFLKDPKHLFLPLAILFSQLHLKEPIEIDMDQLKAKQAQGTPGIPAGAVDITKLLGTPPGYVPFDVTQGEKYGQPGAGPGVVGHLSPLGAEINSVFKDIVYPKLKERAANPNNALDQISLAMVFDKLSAGEQKIVQEMLTGLTSAELAQGMQMNVDKFTVNTAWMDLYPTFEPKVQESIARALIKLVEVNAASGENWIPSNMLIAFGFIYRFQTDDQIKDSIFTIMAEALSLSDDLIQPGALLGAAYMFPHLESYKEVTVKRMMKVAISDTASEEVKAAALRALGMIYQYLEGDNQKVAYVLKLNIGKNPGALWGLGYAYEHLNETEWQTIFNDVEDFVDEILNGLIQKGEIGPIHQILNGLTQEDSEVAAEIRRRLAESGVLNFYAHAFRRFGLPIQMNLVAILKLMAQQEDRPEPLYALAVIYDLMIVTKSGDSPQNLLPAELLEFLDDLKQIKVKLPLIKNSPLAGASAPQHPLDPTDLEITQFFSAQVLPAIQKDLNEKPGENYSLLADLFPKIDDETTQKKILEYLERMTAQDELARFTYYAAKAFPYLKPALKDIVEKQLMEKAITTMTDHDLRYISDIFEHLSEPRQQKFKKLLLEKREKNAGSFHLNMAIARILYVLEEGELKTTLTNAMMEGIGDPINNDYREAAAAIYEKLTPELRLKVLQDFWENKFMGVRGLAQILRFLNPTHQKDVFDYVYSIASDADAGLSQDEALKGLAETYRYLNPPNKKKVVQLFKQIGASDRQIQRLTAKIYGRLPFAPPIQIKMEVDPESQLTQEIKDFNETYYTKIFTEAKKTEQPQHTTYEAALGVIRPYADTFEGAKLDELLFPPALGWENGMLEAAGFAYEAYSDKEVMLSKLMTYARTGNDSALISLGRISKFVSPEERLTIYELFLSQLNQSVSHYGALLGLAYLYPHLTDSAQKKTIQDILGTRYEFETNPIFKGAAIQGLALLFPYLTSSKERKGLLDDLIGHLKEGTIPYSFLWEGLGAVYPHAGPKQRGRIDRAILKIVKQAAKHSVDWGPFGSFFRGAALMYPHLKKEIRDKVYPMIKKAADQGNAEAHIALALIYRAGKEAEINSKYRFDLAIKAGLVTVTKTGDSHPLHFDIDGTLNPPTGNDYPLSSSAPLVSATGQPSKAGQIDKVFHETAFPKLFEQAAADPENSLAMTSLSMAAKVVMNEQLAKSILWSFLIFFKGGQLQFRNKQAMESFGHYHSILKKEEQDQLIQELLDHVKNKDEFSYSALLGLASVFHLFQKGDIVRSQILKTLSDNLKGHPLNIPKEIPMAAALVYRKIKDDNSHTVLVEEKIPFDRLLHIIFESLCDMAVSEAVSAEAKANALRALGFIYEDLDEAKRKQVFKILESNIGKYPGALWGLGYAHKSLTFEQLLVAAGNVMTILVRVNIALAANNMAEAEDLAKSGIFQFYAHVAPSALAPDVFKVIQKSAALGIPEALYALAVLYADAKKDTALVTVTKDDSHQPHLGQTQPAAVSDWLPTNDLEGLVKAGVAKWAGNSTSAFTSKKIDEEYSEDLVFDPPDQQRKLKIGWRLLHSPKKGVSSGSHWNIVSYDDQPEGVHRGVLESIIIKLNPNDYEGSWIRRDGNEVYIKMKAGTLTKYRAIFYQAQFYDTNFAFHPEGTNKLVITRKHHRIIFDFAEMVDEKVTGKTSKPADSDSVTVTKTGDSHPLSFGGSALEIDVKTGKLNKIHYEVLPPEKPAKKNPELNEIKKNYLGFESVNNSVLAILNAKKNKTVGDFNTMMKLMDEMIRYYLHIFKGQPLESPVENAAKASSDLTGGRSIARIFLRIKNDLSDQLKNLNTEDPLPESVEKKMNDFNADKTSKLIGKGAEKYSQNEMDDIFFAELINIVHQKGIRNLPSVIAKVNAERQQAKVKIKKERGEKQSTKDFKILSETLPLIVPYYDARENPNKQHPLALQYVANAFAKGQFAHHNKDIFDPENSLIFADDNLSAITLGLGAHSAHIQFSLKPVQEGGRVTVNYTDSGGAYEPGSSARLKALVAAFTAAGFKVHSGGYHMDAYFDKDNGASSIDQLPEKLEFAIQVLTSTKDLDFNITDDVARSLGVHLTGFSSGLSKFPDQDAAIRVSEELAKRIAYEFALNGYLIREVYSAASGHVSAKFTPMTFSSNRPISGEVIKLIQEMGKFTGTNTGLPGVGQRTLDELDRKIEILLARGALIQTINGRLLKDPVYQEARKESPVKHFLEEILKADSEKLTKFERIAFVATVVESFTSRRTLGTVGAYQIEELTLPLIGDQVVFYILRNREDGKIHLANAVLGEFYYDQPRYDLFRKKEIPNNELSYADIEALLIPQGMVFDSKAFIPAFELDSLWTETDRRQGISPIALSGVSINEGTSLAKAVLNTEGKKAGDFQNGILIAPYTEPKDDDSIKASTGVVVTTGGILSHAAIRSREHKKPAVILNGAEFTPLGLIFKTFKGSDQKNEITAAGKTISYYELSDYTSEEVAVQDGDLIYLDANTGTFYLVAKTADEETLQVYERYSRWKEKLGSKWNEALGQELGSIFAATTNDNLLRAIVSDLVHEVRFPSDEVEKILLDFAASGNGKAEVVLEFLRGKANIAIKAFKEGIIEYDKVVSNTKTREISDTQDFEQIYLMVDRLLENAGRVEKLLKLVNGKGVRGYNQESLEGDKAQIVSLGKDWVKDMQAKVLREVRNVQPDEIHLIRGIKIERKFELAGLDVASAWPEIAQKITDLKAAREAEVQKQIGRGIIWKENLKDRFDRPIAGGKGAHSGEIYRAIETLKKLGVLPENVVVPQGFVIQPEEYRLWKAAGSPDELDRELKKTLALGYRDLVIRQADDILSAIKKDDRSYDLMKRHIEAPVLRLRDALPQMDNPVVIDLLIQNARTTVLSILQFFSMQPEQIKIAQSLKNRLEVLGAVAVRSSGLREDSHEEAMAGMRESPLNKFGLKHLYESVLTVWKSGAEGVLVEIMFNAFDKASGIAFSADPVSKRVDRISISSAYGQAKGLVDHQVESPDTHLLAKITNGEIKYELIGKPQLGAKEKMVVLDIEQGGIKVVQRAPSPNQAALDDKIVPLVAQTVDLLAQSFGFQGDMEFSTDADFLVPLQFRPVTTISESIKRGRAALLARSAPGLSETGDSRGGTKEGPVRSELRDDSHLEEALIQGRPLDAREVYDWLEGVRRSGSNIAERLDEMKERVIPTGDLTDTDAENARGVTEEIRGLDRPAGIRLEITETRLKESGDTKTVLRDVMETARNLVTASPYLWLDLRLPAALRSEIRKLNVNGKDPYKVVFTQNFVFILGGKIPASANLDQADIVVTENPNFTQGRKRFDAGFYSDSSRIRFRDPKTASRLLTSAAVSLTERDVDWLSYEDSLIRARSERGLAQGVELVMQLLAHSAEQDLTLSRSA